MIDYHIHTSFSDGKNSHQEYIEKAKELGLTEIGFSDHICLKYPKWAVKKESYKIISETLKLIKLNSDSNLKVKFGFEVDYFEGKELEIADEIKQFPLDYTIGSVHYINDWNFDTNRNDYSNLDLNQFYLDYFNLIQKAAASGLFDIIGHIDLAKKFNYYPSFDLKQVYKRTAIALKESDIVFELNTSGLDKDCKEFYPSDDFLKILYESGVHVTLGSDSHNINHLARYYKIAIAKLKAVGYTKLATFKNRETSFVRL